MSDWTSLRLRSIDFGTNSFAKLVQSMATYLSELVSILDFILTTIQEIDDPLTIALKALINEIKNIVEGLIDQAGGYVLYVPVSKRLMTNFLGLGDITPNWANSLGLFESDISTINWNDPKLSKLLTDANRYTGGNAGFFRIILNSLYDSGDLNRPQFYDDDDYVGGVILLTGTNQDPLGLLDDIWTLNGMFGLPDSMPKVPRPKNLTARVLKHTSLNAENTNYMFDTFLTWDPPEPTITSIKDLGGSTIYPDRYAIIRCKNDTNILSAANIVDLMNKRNISINETSIDGNCTVIYEDDYNVADVNYLDQDIEATIDDIFYYAIAWKLKGNNPKEVESINNEIEFDYWHISNVVRVVPYSTVPDSTYPDWLRTPSVTDLFPSIATMLRKMTAYLEGVSGKIIGINNTFDSYIQVLKDEISFYEQLAKNILSQIAKIETLFKLPTTDIYVRSFNGKGGNRFFISDLAASLVPRSDKIVPPFHTGDEYVTGLVLLTGGPQLNINAFLTALNFFFNFEDSTTNITTSSYLDTSETIETSDLNTILENLNTIITKAEEVTFKENMTVGTEKIVSNTFSEKTIKDIVQCSKPESPDIFFDANMKVISNANV